MIYPVMDNELREYSFQQSSDQASTSRPIDTNQIRRYIMIAFASAITLLVLSATFNLLVDAKGLYGMVRVGGFNSHKAFQNNYGKEVKTFGVRAYLPNTVFFGASTVDRGIVPECERTAFSGGPLRIYNAASGGDSPLSFLIEYPNVRSIGTVQRIEIETRFPTHPMLSAKQHGRSSIPRDDDLFSRYTQPWLPPRFAINYLSDFFSWKAFILNYKTVAANKGATASVFHGYGADGRFDQDWLKATSPRVIGKADALNLAVSYHRLFTSRLTNDMKSDFSYVEAFAAAAARDNIELDFFIPPEHALLLLSYSIGGVWPLYEQFKRELLEATDAAKTRHGVTIRVFDFSAFNQVTEQPVKAAARPTTFDPYYEDLVHFRKIVGDFILAKMLSCHFSEQVPDGFGIELNRHNIDAHLVEQRARLGLYHRLNAELAGALTEQMARTTMPRE
jgi:hypothetical protein